MAAAAAREEVGFELMETYIWKIQNMVAQYVAMRPILDLFKAEESNWGYRVGMRWWEQELIGLLGARDMAV